MIIKPCGCGLHSVSTVVKESSSCLRSQQTLFTPWTMVVLFYILFGSYPVILLCGPSLYNLSHAMIIMSQHRYRNIFPFSKQIVHNRKKPYCKVTEVATSMRKFKQYSTVLSF